MAIGEYLEVAVWMCFQDIEQFRMHERFTTKNPKERIPHCLGFTNQSIHGFYINLLLLSSNIDPASLAPQVAAVGD